ncbi:suppressor of Cytokine Signaling at 16D isoform X2 [Musca autumnalis]|uniref:suppressor of Cytokine Signaling at 16D isoform X2 n=1 Tax=Musca autumnalis TaxID=221902 RepID=UPI003CF7D984
MQKTMDSTVKNKDSTSAPGTTSVIAGICSSDSFSMFPSHHHDLTSTNSIELNAAASLSDDSGVPLTTNSSISSGDSYRLGLCKFDIEIVESDGEVSQFDSLDNCSEGGMSAENFNTLKKGPLAPIDPPPEFQDSPQTTLVRSMTKNPVISLRRWTSSQSSFEHLKDHNNADNTNMSVVTIGNINDESVLITGSYMLSNDIPEKDMYNCNKHLYSSDSILNSHMDNIYDEPNNMLSSSLGNSVDILDSDSPSQSIPPPPPPVSIVKIKQTLCPYFQDHTRYFKAIPSEQDNITSAVQRFNVSGLSEIHDYDLYYGIKRSACQQYDNSLQRKIIYSPLSNSHYCHNHVYHGGMCSNRPNSRNSLNSRLSSSHNSLSVSSANKPDDSIFITQAMSHDALLTREISDFYNVPIDSDIYALPVDMIKSEKERSQNLHRHSIHTTGDANDAECKDTAISNSCSKHVFMKCHHQPKSNRKHKNKRKKRSTSNCPENGENSDRAPSHISTSTSSRYNSTFVSTSSIHDDGSVINAEPLHMSLEEVKQFYHTLYSETKDNKSDSAVACGGPQPHSKVDFLNSTTKVSNDAAWSGSRGSNLLLTQNRVEKSHGPNAKNSVITQKNVLSDSETHTNNNNNMIAINNQNNQKQNVSHQSTITTSTEKEHNSDTTQTILKPNITSTEKKSQFTMNLKQRFCSIFRFRKSNNRLSNKSDANEHDDHTSNEKVNTSKSNEDKRKKFQSRALPPLPKKEPGEESSDKHEEIPCGKEEKKSEARSFHFTSSIEKVKDYGWYWGPLSSEAAEKVLSNEPDGSFIVRDSSDDHYIFSLSFKLNNCVRHVRIEQDQGTFSFGSYAKFKSQTITEFIEKAVEHSRSGRYLFFLHRRPEHGPMRVQLTNPVSRFKHVQSLQHMCRFVILKAVIRKDLIQTLPLPRRLLDYLNYKHCYSEQIESDSSNSQNYRGNDLLEVSPV